MENRIKNQIEATISVCANGHDVYAVMLSNFRLFGSKCCGRWTVVRKYKTTLGELREDLGEAVPELIGVAPVLSAEDIETLRGMRESRYLSADEAGLLDRLLGASR